MALLYMNSIFLNFRFHGVQGRKIPVKSQTNQNGPQCQGPSELFQVLLAYIAISFYLRSIFITALPLPLNTHSYYPLK